jgi:putative transposase
MVRFSFKKGLRFLQQTRGWTLVRRLASGKFQLEDDAGELTNLEEPELHRRWVGGEWQIDEESLGASKNVFYFTTPKDLKSLPEDEQKDVKRKADYLNGILRLFKQEGQPFVSSHEKLAPKIRAVALELEDAQPPSPETVWRWWSRFAVTKCITKLQDGRRNSGRTYDATQRSLFDEAVAEVFLTPQKKPGKAVVEAVRTKVKRVTQGLDASEHIAVPSPATIYRWLKSLYYQITQNARQGKVATAKELRSAVDGVNVKKILERVEIDHTPVDLMIICKLTRLVLGRPWLTLAIDRRSRMVQGFYISFHAPSSTSVLYCLRMLMLPKDQILAKYPGIKGPWPARGIPECIVCDNGMELHANAVEVICQEMGIELTYCGVAHPEMKGAIERMFRTVNQGLVHMLPGTTFSNVEQRGDYASEKHAAIDLEVFVHLLVKWIADVYHKTPHRGLLGRTPLEVWQEEESNCVIELPAYPKQLDTIVGHAASRTLFHYGVEYDNLRYNSPLLQIIRQRAGGNPEVHLRGFEHDVGYITVLDPQLDEFIEVPAVRSDYAAGLNAYVHHLCVAEVRKRFGNEWAADQLLAVKAEIQVIVDEAVLAHKTATRKAGATVLLHDSEQILGTQDESPLQRARKPVNTAAAVLPDLDPGADDELPSFKRTERNQEMHA